MCRRPQPGVEPQPDGPAGRPSVIASSYLTGEVIVFDGGLNLT